MKTRRAHDIRDGFYFCLGSSPATSRRQAHRGKESCSKRKLRDERGQASIEYALVLAAFLALLLALGILWRALESGLFVEHALASASHHISNVFMGVVGDVFLY